MGKANDTFGRMKFQPPQNLLLQGKTNAASRESKIELLMLVSDFMVNSTLKILNGVSVESMECLNEDV